MRTTEQQINNHVLPGQTRGFGQSETPGDVVSSRRVDHLEDQLARLRTVVIVLAVVLVVVLAAVAVTASARATTRQCPADASICYYRLPDSIQDARNACYRAEGARLDVPQTRDAYVAWWHSADAAQRAGWEAASKRCQDQHQLPGGKWAWDQMIYVGSR